MTESAMPAPPFIEQREAWDDDWDDDTMSRAMEDYTAGRWQPIEEIIDENS